MKIVRWVCVAASLAGLALIFQTRDARAEGCRDNQECGGPDGSGGKGTPTGHVVTQSERFLACINAAQACFDPCWIFGYPGVAVCGAARGCGNMEDACIAQYCGANAVPECSQYVHPGGQVSTP